MVKITYLGHATLLIEIDGLRLLTDPVVRNRLLHLYRFSDPIDPTFYQDIDAVLISHLHLDHLDLPSLRKLVRTYKLFVPRGSARYLKQKGFPHAVELPIGETISLGPLTIQAAPADHVSFRPPFGPRSESIGFIIHGSPIAWMSRCCQSGVGGLILDLVTWILIGQHKP
jgi:L-ascorbate metabolism protein UlaG (beta-lactamase superfamily)